MSMLKKMLSRSPFSPTTFTGILLVSLAVGLVAGKQTDMHQAVVNLDYGFGPQIKSLIDDGRLGGHYGIGGVPDPNGMISYAARMPLVPVLAAMSWHLSKNVLILFLLKNFFALALWAYALFRLQRYLGVGDKLVWIVLLAMLLVPDNLSIFGFVNVEEGYLSALVPLLFVLLLTTRSILDAVSLSAVIACIYLTKSSMLPVCVVAALWVPIVQRPQHKLTSVLPSVALFVVLISWAAYIHSFTGVYAIGANSSSWNGWNLYKGNNQFAAALYPTQNLDILDRATYANDLLPSAPYSNEWQLNDAQTLLATRFMSNHSAATLVMLKKKVVVLCCDLRGSPVFRSGDVLSIESNAVNHLLLWTSVAFALSGIVKRRPQPSDALTLLLTVAYLAPYFLGFLYTRHLVPLHCLAAFAIAVHLGKVPEMKAQQKGSYKRLA